MGTFSMGISQINTQFVILFPSGSDMIGVPTSMTDSFGGTTGEYVLEV